SWLSWSLWNLPDFSWHRTPWLLILIPCGVIIGYCCRFFFASTAVIFTRSENLQFLWYQIYKLGMRPDSIYQPWLKLLFMTLLPVAMIASVPARSVVEEPQPLLFIWAVVISGILLWLSGRF